MGTFTSGSKLDGLKKIRSKKYALGNGTFTEYEGTLDENTKSK